MSATKILILLGAVSGVLALCARLLFPRIGVPDHLAQTISFTASVGAALLFLIHRWRLPATTALRDQAAASLQVVMWLMFAANRLDSANTRLSEYSAIVTLLISALTIILIVLLWHVLIARRRSEA